MERNLLTRLQQLYSTDLVPELDFHTGAGDENRTRVLSLGS